MSAGARTFSKGELMGAVAAALAVGFFLGSMFMELRGPAQPQAPAAQAQQAQQGGDIPADMAAQIRELEMATAQKPGDQTGWIHMGNAYFDAHQPKKAIAAYEKAVALGPVSADVWTDLGIMHRENGEAKKAVETFDTALKLDPAHQNALYNKGVVQLHDLGDKAGARASWERLIKANPAAKTPDGRPLKDVLEQMAQMGKAAQ